MNLKLVQWDNERKYMYIKSNWTDHIRSQRIYFKNSPKDIRNEGRPVKRQIDS